MDICGQTSLGLLSQSLQFVYFNIHNHIVSGTVINCITEYTSLLSSRFPFNFLTQVPIKRAETLKHERPIVISNISVASRMGQAAKGSNFFVAATEKLPVRALSFKAVFSIRATKQPVQLHSLYSPQAHSSMLMHAERAQNVLFPVTRQYRCNPS